MPWFTWTTAPGAASDAGTSSDAKDNSTPGDTTPVESTDNAAGSQQPHTEGVAPPTRRHSPPLPPLIESEVATAPESAEQQQQQSLGSSSAITEKDLFSPEHHSWIMVPDSPPQAGAAAAGSPTALGSPLPLAESGVGAEEAAEAAEAAKTGETEAAKAPADAPVAQPPATGRRSPTTPPRRLGSPASPAATSPAALRESILNEGEDVAALAVSEILSSEWPLSPDPNRRATPSPPLSATDASLADRAVEAKKLGALGAPCGKLDAEGVAEGVAEEEEEAPSEAGPPVDDDLFAIDALAIWGDLSERVSMYRKPLAVAAVLVASHAACVFIGMALGRRLDSSSSGAAASNDVYLARRFSSGASGTHARLCMA